MKMNYSKPFVQAIDMIPACTIMQVSPNTVPTFNGTSIDPEGPQGDAR